MLDQSVKFGNRYQLHVLLTAGSIDEIGVPPRIGQCPAVRMTFVKFFGASTIYSFIEKS